MNGADRMSAWRDEVAGALGEHPLHASLNICVGCDWRPTAGLGSLYAQHRAHLADALLPLLARIDREARAGELREVCDALYRGEGPDHTQDSDIVYGEWLGNYADRIEAKP